MHKILIVLSALAVLTACASQPEAPWTNLGSYVKGDYRICTYSRGNATGTAVVAPDENCPAKPD